MIVLTTSFKGREYTITSSEEAPKNLRAHYLSVGFDGYLYQGISIATGRQRKDFSNTFLRNARTGDFTTML